ncbi:type II toxin-antitoxin system HipA family toxin [Halomonas llamarensis]|uniref:Type II toxin-antitoxin system HipA family toxin n=1 Tax=Halomonas llamarensis TaxID=2945104 RepID=A0ABT0SUI5_9GAMM|nr:type II toxin-antitoxin system HipA family toxin [Halomonas llamarensis]MCL7931243.1 type II toxin-antitoxin system HipA family toxin [Halomonas llamarensis]
MACLKVALNGIEVGELQLAPSGAMAFRYAATWLQRHGARAISLSLPLSSTRYRGPVVYNFFDNLLPDSENIRARMQARFQAPTSQPFDLLAAVGRDCVGAIQLYPENEPIPDVRSINTAPMDDEAIGNLLSGYQEAPLGMNPSRDFRMSLAGAQEKMALLWYQNRWHLPLSATPTSHIIKMPIGFLSHSNIDLRESGENEWLCLKILQAFGLPVANAELASFGKQRVLVVERFDRRWSHDHRWLMRLPQEDFCQALGVSPALKYENDGGPGIEAGMQLLMGSQNAAHDRDTFFKANIMFWLLAAIDGHAKNFSLFLEPGSAYRMTPLYDVISAYPLMAKGSLPSARAKMAMSLKSKHRHYHWSRIQPRHFFSTAREANLAERRVTGLIDDILNQSHSAFASIHQMLPADFPEDVSTPILDGLNAKLQQLAVHNQ